MTFNWIIFIIFSLGILAVGSISKRILDKKTENNDESFLLGGRTIGEFVGAATIIATGYSGWGFIGSPGSAYQFGTIEVLANFFFAPAIAMGTLFFAGFMRKRAQASGGMTIPEYIANSHKGKEKDRKWVQVLAGLTSFIFLSIYMVGQIRAIGFVGAKWLGIDEIIVAILFLTIITIFTVQGGFLAVALTDTIMCMGMILATLLVSFVVFRDISFPEMIKSLGQIDPELINPSTSAPYGQGPFSVYLVFVYALLFTTSLPYMSVRFLSLKKNIKIHKLALYLVPMGLILSIIPIVGLYMRIKKPGLEIPDQVMPLFLNIYLHPMLASIITLFILFAMLSTISSVLQTQAAALSYDIFAHFGKNKWRDSKRINQLSILFTSFFCILLSFFAPQSMLNQISYLGTGGIIAMFSGPILMNRYSQTSLRTCLLSMLVGFLSHIYFVSFLKLGWVESPIYSSLLNLGLYLLLSLWEERDRISLEN